MAEAPAPTIDDVLRRVREDGPLMDRVAAIASHKASNVLSVVELLRVDVQRSEGRVMSRLDDLEARLRTDGDGHMAFDARMNKLNAQVVHIGTDVGWLKRFFWLVAASSVGSLLTQLWLVAATSGAAP